MSVFIFIPPYLRIQLSGFCRVLNASFFKPPISQINADDLNNLKLVCLGLSAKTSVVLNQKSKIECCF
jgi:hypothetical protein